MFNKNIYVRLKGGLGNQLFIYAFGLARSKKKNKNLIIDNISGFGPKDKYKGVYSLSGFKIHGFLIKRLFFGFLISNRYFWWLGKKLNFIFLEKDLEHNKEVDKTNLIFFEGYWQTYLYFDEYKTDIKESLQIEKENLFKISAIEEKISNSKNAVAVCMRFYDAFKEDEKVYGVCSKDFYENAMSYLESFGGGQTYYVFSSNIEKSKKFFALNKKRKIVFVEPQVVNSDAYLDLYLMTLCQNFIISNSTMYWWAAYLGEKEKSTVLCPREGFLYKKTLPSNWIKFDQ